MTGSTLGNYQIVRLLGAGGMGQVYLAEHLRIKRQVAIKILLPELSANTDLVERFFNEARATSLVQHPAIVSVFDCDVFEGRAFIVMEALKGEPLRNRLARAPMGEPEAVVRQIGRRIAEAMAVTHAHGIVHRDLKPDNVFLIEPLGADPQIKILDFGIAKLSQHEGSTKTATGTLMGSPAYMSPEQCRGAGAVDWRTDIYSLGCILFEMATGVPPFQHEGAGALIVGHLTEPPPSPQDRCPTLSAELSQLILQMLAKQPEQRPQKMEAVAAHLAGEAMVAAPPAITGVGATQILPPQPAAAPAIATTTFRQAATTAQVTAELPRSRASWLLAAGVAAVAVAVLVWAPWQVNQPVDETLAVAPVAPVVVEPPPPATLPETVRIDFQGLPSEATIWIDGQPKEMPLKLPRGQESHEVVVKAEGYQDLRMKLTPKRDQTIVGNMQPVAAPATTERKPKARTGGKGQRGPKQPDRFGGFSDI